MASQWHLSSSSTRRSASTATAACQFALSRRSMPLTTYRLSGRSLYKSMRIGFAKRKTMIATETENTCVPLSQSPRLPALRRWRSRRLPEYCNRRMSRATRHRHDAHIIRRRAHSSPLVRHYLHEQAHHVCRRRAFARIVRISRHRGRAKIKSSCRRPPSRAAR